MKCSVNYYDHNTNTFTTELVEMRICPDDIDDNPYNDALFIVIASLMIGIGMWAIWRKR